MVNNICFGTHSLHTHYTPSALPRVPTNVQNILKTIGAAFAFLGSGAWVLSAAVGAANPIGATVMAIGLAAIGIILLASMKKCSDESECTTTPAGGLPFTPQPEVIRVGFVRQPTPPPVQPRPIIVTPAPAPAVVIGAASPAVVIGAASRPTPVFVAPDPVTARVAFVASAPAASRPVFVASIPSATSPGMTARLPVSSASRPAFVASIPSATSPGMNARLPAVVSSASRPAFVASIPSATSPGMNARVPVVPASPSHAHVGPAPASAHARAARDTTHPYVRSADRPAPPQSGGHAAVGGRRNR